MSKTPFVPASTFVYLFCIIGLGFTYYLSTDPQYLNLDKTFVSVMKWIIFFSSIAHIFHGIYPFIFAKTDKIKWSIQGFLCGMFSTRLMKTID
eukprot:gene1900-1040_t